MQLIDFFQMVLSNYWFGIGCLVVSITIYAAAAITWNKANNKDFDKVLKIIDSQEYKELLRAINLRNYEIDIDRDCYERKSNTARSISESHNYHMKIRDCDERISEIKNVLLILHSTFS